MSASALRGKSAQSSAALFHFRYRFAEALAYKREMARIEGRNRAPIPSRQQDALQASRACHLFIESFLNDRF
jgi:hypothetical protein